MSHKDPKAFELEQLVAEAQRAILSQKDTAAQSAMAKEYAGKIEHYFSELVDAGYAPEYISARYKELPQGLLQALFPAYARHFRSALTHYAGMAVWPRGSIKRQIMSVPADKRDMFNDDYREAMRIFMAQAADKGYPTRTISEEFATMPEAMQREAKMIATYVDCAKRSLAVAHQRGWEIFAVAAQYQSIPEEIRPQLTETFIGIAKNILLKFGRDPDVLPVTITQAFESLPRELQSDATLIAAREKVIQPALDRLLAERRAKKAAAAKLQADG